MGNVLTVEAAAPTVLAAAAIIAINVALKCSKRESGPSQENTATGNASMTTNQLTYSGLNHPVINTTIYYGNGTLAQLPSDTTSRLLFTTTDLTLPPQEQVLNVASEATSQLPLVSGTTTQVQIPVNVIAERTSQLLSARSEPQSPPVNLMNANDGSQLIRVGVWGNPNAGNSFKHKGFDGIKTIKICSSSTSVIYSIEVEYTKDGELRKVEKAGGKDGCPQESECDQQETIVLETGEYINKVSGYYCPYNLDGKKVRSLSFTTNMDRLFGPYGETVDEDDEKANTTSFYVEGGKVVGFYGNAKTYISAIGFYVLPLDTREGNDRDRLIKVGLWGKQKTIHSFKHLGHEGIQYLRISSDSVIDWFDVKYRNDNTLHREGGRGGDGGERNKIVFEDGEYINKVIGYYGNYYNPNNSTTYETVNQLTFTTSKIDRYTQKPRIFGPYGMIYQHKDRKKATKFSVKGGRIVGFHGTGGKYVSSIGFYILPPDSESTSQLPSESGTTATQLPATPVKMMELIITAPWGHPDERFPFNHNGYDGIKTIKIWCGWVIDSIEVQYTRRGELVWAPKTCPHGGNLKMIDLDDGEYINEVTGYYGRLFKTGTINSLTFFTNRNNKFGPYGLKNGTRSEHIEEEPTPFQVRGGKIVGFHGTFGRFMSSIGFYVSPLV